MESKNENKRKKEGKEDDKQRGKKGTDQRRAKRNKQKGMAVGLQGNNGGEGSVKGEHGSEENKELGHPH
jgi:hypothetical protein